MSKLPYFAPGNSCRYTSSQAAALTVQATGDGSAIKPGTRVLIEGPYGTLTEAVRRRPSMVMIASGFGVTPFIGMLQDA